MNLALWSGTEAAVDAPFVVVAAVFRRSYHIIRRRTDNVGNSLDNTMDAFEAFRNRMSGYRIMLVPERIGSLSSV